MGEVDPDQAQALYELEAQCNIVEKAEYIRKMTNEEVKENLLENIKKISRNGKLYQDIVEQLEIGKQKKKKPALRSLPTFLDEIDDEELLAGKEAA